MDLRKVFKLRPITQYEGVIIKKNVRRIEGFSMKIANLSVLLEEEKVTPSAQKILTLETS